MAETETRTHLKLVGTDGNRFFAFDLAPGRYLVGRREECDLCVPDRTVSRKHAEIEVDSEHRCFVTDLGSHNGTTLNGAPVTSRIELLPGQRISFGQVEFTLKANGAGTASTVRPSVARLATAEPEKSVFLSINEALKPLPSKVTDLPDLFPVLSEMARMLVLSEPKEVMLERSLKLVAKVVPAERLAILFTSPDESEVYTAATLLPGGKDPGEFTLSRTIVRDILTKKNAILIGDSRLDDRYAEQQSIVAMDLKSAMAVPLFDEGKVLGILYVDTTNPLHCYGDDYLRLLATFGNVIASRLLNYELLEERQEKQVMEAELARASAIQKNLIQPELPDCPGYRIYAYQHQCRAVGGDLYDVARLPDGRLILMLADVSGKGMGAALLMANILASFRVLYRQPQFDLVPAVNEVSRQLFRYSAPGDFATLFLGVLDPETHELHYVNAGHNPPYLMHPDGTYEELLASGTMVGAFDMMSWSEASAAMPNGTLLCVFTDGVTEAEKEDGQQYGEDRVLQILQTHVAESVSQVGEALVQDVRRFVEGAPQSDDITLLMLKRE